MTYSHLRTLASTVLLPIKRLSCNPFYYVDSDGNGMIEFPEFLTMVNGNLSKSKQREQLQKIFKIFDTDESNEINAENLKRMFRMFGQDFKEKEIANMLAAADYDQDGKVGLEDFLKMMIE